MNRRDLVRSVLGASAAALFCPAANSLDTGIAPLYKGAVVTDSLCGIYAPGAPPTAGWLPQPASPGLQLSTTLSLTIPRILSPVSPSSLNRWQSIPMH